MATRSLVVKIGTTSVTDDVGGVDYGALANVARDVVELRARDWTVVVVTSGAITAGGPKWARVDRDLRTACRCRPSRPWASRS